MKRSLLPILLLFFLGSCAGTGYKLYHTQSEIEVYGNWKYEKPFEKGKRVLCLKVLNTGSTDRTVNLDVNFYNVAILSETTSIDSLCVPAGKSRKGRKYGLCLVSEEFSNEQLLDSAFHWRIEDLAATAVEDCDM